MWSQCPLHLVKVALVVMAADISLFMFAMGGCCRRFVLMRFGIFRRLVFWGFIDVRVAIAIVDSMCVSLQYLKLWVWLASRHLACAAYLLDLVYACLDCERYRFLCFSGGPRAADVHGATLLLNSTFG